MPPALAAGQHRDVAFVHLPAAEQEAAQKVLGLRTFEPGCPLRTLQHGAAGGELLLLVLREVRGHDAVPRSGRDRPPVDAGRARPRSGSSSRPVRADETDVLAAFERELGPMQKLLVARREPPRSPRPRGRPGRFAVVAGTRSRECDASSSAPEAPRSARALLAQPADLGQLGLRLLGLRLLVAEAGDEALQPLDVVRHPLDGSRCGRRRPRRLLTPPLVPRPGRRTAGRRVSSSTADVTTSRNQRSCATSTMAARADEGALQPLEVVDVEVVRGLSSSNRSDLRQRTRERRCQPLSAGERVERPVEIVLREAEAAQGRRCASAPGPAACMPLEPRLRVAVAP